MLIFDLCYSAEKAMATAVIATASDTKSIYSAILQSMSFLKRKANGVRKQIATKPTMAVGIDISFTCGAYSDIHAHISAITFSAAVIIARHSVIIGTIFFIP